MRIIGHRGARGEAPENTLGGFQYIQDLGIRAVEFDVRQLKDRALVIMHDDQFMRTAGQDKHLYECSSQELEPYNHAVTWSEWNKVEPTPLLEQTLKIIHNFDHIEVEVKAVKTQAEAEALTETLEQQLQGFEHSGLLVETDVKFKAIEQAIELGCIQIGWMNQLANSDIIQATQQAKLNVSVWTVNDVDRAKQLKDWGINGLITDYPKLMMQHF